MHLRPLCHRQHLLARLDRQLQHPLDCPRRFGSGLWIRISNRLHLTIDICHRRIQDILRQRTSSFCRREKYCRCILTLHRDPAVRLVGRFVGDFGAGVCQSGVYTDSVRVVALWR
jgi:hypothetical protein